MQYTIYGGELSLFTRKLDAACIFYGLDFRMVGKAEDNRELVELRSGTHQVPVMLTPENWMIGDTTPLLALLDGRYPERAMFPAGPEGVLTHVIEEFFDEWVARVMVHYRWHYPASAKFAANKMANGNPAIVERMLDWGPRACRATGTAEPSQQQAAEAEYVQILAAAEAQLQKTAFLLGDRPTAVDCIVLGGLRAHTNMDPDPKKVVAMYPTVVDWAERRADTWDGKGELASFAQPTDFVRHVLDIMPTTYLPYVLANADSHNAGAKAFHCETYGEDVSYLSRPYPERSRQMVVDRVSKLGDPAVNDWLSEVGLAKAFC